LAELNVGRLATRHDQEAAHPEERKAELSHDTERAQRAGRSDVELLSLLAMPEVFEPAVNGRDVRDPERRRRPADPFQPPPVCVDEGERRARKPRRQRETGQASARPEIDPAFPSPWHSESSQAERIIDVTLTQPSSFPGTQEAVVDRLMVRSFERVDNVFAGVSPQPAISRRHVSRETAYDAAGWMITWRSGSSPMLSVIAPSTIATASWTILRSYGVMGCRRSERPVWTTRSAAAFDMAASSA